jgi:GTP-binding protein
MDGSDPADNALTIIREIERFSPTLAARERWLVLNKTDLIDEDTLAEIRARVIDVLQWTAPIYTISALAHDGTDRLCQNMMDYLERCVEDEALDPELVIAERQAQQAMQEESRERAAILRARRHGKEELEDEADDDDDHDVEIEYAP